MGFTADSLLFQRSRLRFLGATPKHAREGLGQVRTSEGREPITPRWLEWRVEQIPGRRTKQTQPQTASMAPNKMPNSMYELEEKEKERKCQGRTGEGVGGQSFCSISILIGRTFSSTLQQRCLRPYTFHASFLSTLTNNFSSFSSL